MSGEVELTRIGIGSVVERVAPMMKGFNSWLLEYPNKCRERKGWSCDTKNRCKIWRCRCQNIGNKATVLQSQISRSQYIFILHYIFH